MEFAISIQPSPLSERVLVLNASYEPINVCGAKRAITMIFSGIALTQEKDRRLIRSPSTSINLPNVIRLVRYVRTPQRRFAFSKRNIFLRDNFTCQYCQKKISAKDLTLDHILPQSRDGENSWDNLVTSCRSCNVQKGDRTPEEAGMHLQRPKKSHYHSFLHYLHRKGGHKQSWRRYLFFEYSDSEWSWEGDDAVKN